MVSVIVVNIFTVNIALKGLLNSGFYCTPCIKGSTKLRFLIPLSLQPDVVDLKYSKPLILLD